jgi:undecaprenyl-phosphate 4-deoxy-4-formamido-L-arabinose transferase
MNAPLPALPLPPPAKPVMAARGRVRRRPDAHRMLPLPAPGVSVLIPVFNEEAGLATLFARLYRALDALALHYEVVFIDDGSVDDSVAILARQFRRRPDVTRIVLLNGNYGQHMALLAGFAAARGATVVTLDADLQNPPEEIARLLEKIREGYDYVGSIRRLRHDSSWRSIASGMMNRVRERITNIRISDQGNMLRAYGREVVELINRCTEVNTFVPALAYAFARKPTEIVVEHEARAAGKSKYSLYSLIRLNFDLITGFSLVPLQVFSMLGMLMACASALLVALLLERRFGMGAEAEGVFTLFAIVFFFLGLTLFGIGLLGEYVGRILQQVRGRPRFVVRAVLEHGPAEPHAARAPRGRPGAGLR